jgi:hypothetical protein
MKRSTLLLVLVALLSPLPAFAQIDDYDYAIGLANRGYFELAREGLNAIIEDTSRPAEERSVARLGLVGVVKRDADRETDGDAKIAKYREAEKGYAEFVEDPANQDHPKFFDALFERGELLQSKGEAITRLIAQGGGAAATPEGAAALREEGTEAIRGAQEMLQRASD